MKHTKFQLKLGLFFFLLALAFVLLTSVSNNTLESYSYMEVFPVKPRNARPELVVSGYFGDLEKHPNAKQVIYNEDGTTPRLYITFVDALNEFGKYGWQVKAVYDKFYPNQSRPTLTYLLEKKN